MKSISRIPLIAILAISFACAAAQTAANQNASQPDHLTRSFVVNTGSTLSVQNYKGTIHVTGGSGNQVSVTVEKKFEGSESDRKWWMDKVHVNFENDPSRVRVAVDYPNNSCMFWCDEQHSDYTAWVELTIQVPQKTNLDIEGYKPEIRLASVEGDIRVKSYKAPIEIASTTGPINISTYKESVRLRDVTVRGDLRLKMYKGEAEVVAKNLGQDAEIEIEKGSAVVRVPRNAGLTVDYSGGRRSSFHTDLPLATETGFHSGDIRGSINGGGTHLRLRTERGSFSIEAAQ
ncbi:MAG: hypothetical protein JOZ10_11400 [Acidobacteria bacterium]|nr:hypothetical protein [Acidobacteriota bacterium]MBV9147323.1 hypothetical protein [Acidobacteriota bacterium]MBV9435470.1 hypothetical protein [Acidobacteriota bacterium]